MLSNSSHTPAPALGGKTQTFRRLLSRFGILESETTARHRRIFDALHGSRTTAKWLVEKLLRPGHFVMYVADNLDWAGKPSHFHDFCRSKNDTGTHILNRQCNILFCPEGVIELPDDWRLRSEISLEECMELTFGEKAAELLFLKSHLLAHDEAIDGDLASHEAKICAFQRLHAKESLDEEQSEFTRADLPPKRVRTVVFSIGVNGENCVQSNPDMRQIENDAAPTDRLRINAECCGSEVIVVRAASAFDPLPSL